MKMSAVEQACYDAGISDIIGAYRMALEATKSRNGDVEKLGKSISSAIELGLRQLIPRASTINHERFKNAKGSN
jgi:hypothetical protein